MLSYPQRPEPLRDGLFYLEKKWMTKKLEITGKRAGYALVDDDLYEYLNQFKWNMNRDGYVKRGEYSRLPNGKLKRTEVKLHRLVMDTPKGMVTDHINGDRLDNRRENLRVCTVKQNSWNKRPRGSLNIVGVWFDPARSKFVAHIAKAGHKVTIGRYDTAQEAANARDKVAGELYGEYAYLNGSVA